MGKYTPNISLIPPFYSVDITKGKHYLVLKDYGDGFYDIKDDAAAVMFVNAAESIITFGVAWRVVQ